MSKQQKLSGTAYHKLKATRECEERKYAASLHVFQQKKYIAKEKCKDKDAQYTSELGEMEHRDNVNMVATNKEKKAEEEFPAGIYVIKETEGDMMIC